MFKKDNKKKQILRKTSGKTPHPPYGAQNLSLEDLIANGEDFELNRWRCLETPDRACADTVGVAGGGRSRVFHFCEVFADVFVCVIV